MTNLTIDTRSKETRINKELYGIFIEHVGTCIYDGIWVGENSEIPNIRGIRKDVVEALKNINVPVIRWPGGCIADIYHWKNGIGPRNKRPSVANTCWGNVVEGNQFGTHEFLDLCEQVGAEPYLSANIGSASPDELYDWLEYMTYDGESTLTRMRMANGRMKPWKIKYIGIGNESWECGGYMSPKYYCDVFRRYQTFARNFGGEKHWHVERKMGSQLYKIACGPAPYMLPRGADFTWADTVMCELKEYMDGMSLHHYIFLGEPPHSDSATDFTQSQWSQTMESALFMDEYISKNEAIMDKHDPDRRIGIVVDEWGAWHNVEPGTNPAFLYQQNTIRDALVAGCTLNIFNNHAERVRLATLSMGVNALHSVILTRGETMILTPTYHVFEMYKGHQDSISVPTVLICDKTTSANRTTDSISVSASIKPSGGMLVTLCNIHPEISSEIRCRIEGAKFKHISGKLLSSVQMNSHNDVNTPNLVQPVSFPLELTTEMKFVIQLPARSVAAINLS